MKEVIVPSSIYGKANRDVAVTEDRMSGLSVKNLTVHALILPQDVRSASVALKTVKSYQP